jgi:predicted RNA-binding Zn-ribbon protein involved in translation (DUF1610 family)
MGLLDNFREVVKELKHKRRDESVIFLCPKCTSNKISINTKSNIYPNMYGITPRKYLCPDCGYIGPIIFERIKEKE